MKVTQDNIKQFETKLDILSNKVDLEIKHLKNLQQHGHVLINTSENPSNVAHKIGKYLNELSKQKDQLTALYATSARSEKAPSHWVYENDYVSQSQAIKTQASNVGFTIDLNPSAQSTNYAPIPPPSEILPNIDWGNRDSGLPIPPPPKTPPPTIDRSEYAQLMDTGTIDRADPNAHMSPEEVARRADPRFYDPPEEIVKYYNKQHIPAKYTNRRYEYTSVDQNLVAGERISTDNFLKEIEFLADSIAQVIKRTAVDGKATVTIGGTDPVLRAAAQNIVEMYQAHCNLEIDARYEGDLPPLSNEAQNQLRHRLGADPVLSSNVERIDQDYPRAIHTL